MPTAYIYRGTFQVRSGETLRYREIAPDGVIAPEVTKTYAELAGIGSLSVPAVSLTPSVAAPSLSGVQIGAIAGASVSIQPVVSPAVVSGEQVGNVATAAVSLTPTVAVPSVTGVRVGSIGAATVSLRPTVAAGTLTGVVASAPVVLDDFNSPTGWTSSDGGQGYVSGGVGYIEANITPVYLEKTFTGLSSGKLRFDYRYTATSVPVLSISVNGVSTEFYDGPPAWTSSTAIDCPSGAVTIKFALYDDDNNMSIVEIDNLRWSAT